MSEVTTTEARSFHVNYLLGMSRLPDHFYAMIYFLDGKDVDYKNPGVSLRSFIIARCLRQEIVEVTSREMLQSIAECEEFSRSTRVLSSIVESLQQGAEDLVARIAGLPADLYRDFEMYVSPLSEFSQVVKLSFDAFIMNQDPTKNHVDITSIHGVNLKSAMIDLNELIEDVSLNVPRIPPLLPSRA